MTFDSTWEIGVLLDSCNDVLKPLKSEEYNFEKEEQKEAIEKLYAQAIELTVKDNCGLIMPIDLAICWVEGKCIIDYDGIGYLLDKNGEQIGDMYCDVPFLNKAKENGTVFVAWYNK